jgi:hypothetical protein
MNSFNFFTTSATTPNSNIEKRAQANKFEATDSEDLKG